MRSSRAQYALASTEQKLACTVSIVLPAISLLAWMQGIFQELSLRVFSHPGRQPCPSQAQAHQKKAGGLQVPLMPTAHHGKLGTPFQPEADSQNVPIFGIDAGFLSAVTHKPIASHSCHNRLTTY